MKETPEEEIMPSGAGEKKATRLPQARKPMRECNMKDEYVTIIVQPLDDVPQATCAFNGVLYALLAMQGIDTSVVFRVV